MELNDHLHAPATLLSDKRPSIYSSYLNHYDDNLQILCSGRTIEKNLALITDDDCILHILPECNNEDTGG
jgi:hypothetical protein